MTVANIADYSVVIDDENFSVLDVPGKDTKLVKSERANTLKSIELEKLCKDLGVTGDLINLAYNAIPSQFGNLRAAVSPLHKRFMTLLGKSETQMISLEETAKAILPNLKLVFRFLLEGKEDTAIKFLQTAADKATALHKGMSELAKDFEDLGNDTQKVVGEAEKEQGVQKQELEKQKQALTDLNALTANAKTLSRLLAESKKKLEQKYEEAKAKAESAENRAFALSMVSAILKPVAEGVGSAAGAFARSYTLPMPVPAPTPAPTAAATPPAATPKPDATAGKSKEALQVEKTAAEQKAGEAKTAVEAAVKALEDAEKELTAAKNAVAEARKKVDDKTLTEDKKKEAQEALNIAQGNETAAKDKVAAKKEEKEKRETELREQNAKVAALAQAIETAGKALGEAAGNVGKLGDSYFALAEEYRQEKVNFFKLLMEKEAEEQKTLANLEEYAVRMKNIGEREQTIEVTIAALFRAIGALKQVVATLETVALFWRRMAEACQRLATPEVKEKVEGFKDLDKDLKTELYKENDFKESVVRYLAGWVALQLIANEYRNKTNELFKKVNADYANYLDDKAAKALAADLGGQLLQSTQADKAKSAQTVSQIETAKKQAESEKVEKAAA